MVITDNFFLDFNHFSRWGRAKYRVIEEYSFKALRKVATYNKVHSPSQFDSFFKIKIKKFKCDIFFKVEMVMGFSFNLVSSKFLLMYLSP